MPVIKHTPGPWALDESRYEGCINRIEPFRHIGMVSAYREQGDDPLENRANAVLIAAAPDLLADLVDAAATLRRYETLHRAKGTAESTAKAEVNAALASRFEATIAKATA
jgi:hypothetical protein